MIGEASATDIAGLMAVGEGAPGTRIYIDAGYPYYTSFYLYFQNGSHLVQSLTERNNLTGEVVLGGASFGSSLTSGNGVERSFIISSLLIFLCSALDLYFAASRWINLVVSIVNLNYSIPSPRFIRNYTPSLHQLVRACSKSSLATPHWSIDRSNEVFSRSSSVCSVK